MGTWDAGSFDNDKAQDWVGGLCESDNAAAVRHALNRALVQPKPRTKSLIETMLGSPPVEPQMEAGVAIQALVAAEIVAFWLGHPCPKFPNILEEWAGRHSRSLDPELVTIARQAVAAVLAKSELRSLWEEGNGIVSKEWHCAVSDLERRLQN